MKRFVYDKVTKEFIKEIQPQKNPLKSGEYLFPACSTDVLPPPLKDNEAAVFNGQFWNILPDYRGKLKINLDTLETSVVSDLGNLGKDEMLYSDYLLSDEYENYLIEQEKKDKINALLEQIKALDEKRIRAVCEPSVKDEITGQTWLDYYNSQINVLRQKLSEVGYVA